MAHAQKTDFVFRRNGRVHLNRPGGGQFSRLLAAEVCAISGSNAGYTMFRGSVKSTGHLLHSPVSPSVSLPCVTMCHHISTGLYQFATLSHLNAWYISLDIYVILSHWIFLYVSVHKGPSSGNHTKAIPHITKLATFIHFWSGLQKPDC